MINEQNQHKFVFIQGYPGGGGGYFGTFVDTQGTSFIENVSVQRIFPRNLSLQKINKFCWYDRGNAVIVVNTLKCV